MSAPGDPLDAVRERLYAGPRASFLERRKGLAADARRAGDPALAKEIAGLRKPGVAAHSLNLLAHAGDGELTDLLDLGAGIRAAFAAGDDAQMRELLQQRNASVAATTARARELAGEEGESVSAATAEQIIQTLRAAMATDDDADLVRRGVLTDALDEPGFAALGVGPATRPDRTPQATTGRARTAASKPAAGKRRASKPAASDTAQREAERAEAVAEAALVEAETTSAAAVADAVQRQATIAEHRRELAATRDDLTARLNAIERELAEAERSLTDADKERRRAERSLESARRARRR